MNYGGLCFIIVAKLLKNHLTFKLNDLTTGVSHIQKEGYITLHKSASLTQVFRDDKWDLCFPLPP